MRQLKLFIGLCLIIAGGCRSKLPTAVPVSGEEAAPMVRYYDDNFDPKYDAMASSGQYIAERVGLNPRAGTATEPAILPIDPKCSEAITMGDSCLRFTITNVFNTWMDFLHYSFVADPRYWNDADRVPCWLVSAGALPTDKYGQDWSAYTHFTCDVWINPEKPIHSHMSWWGSLYLYTAMDNYGLWKDEDGLMWGGWDCYYWMPGSTCPDTENMHLRLNHMAYKFSVSTDPSSSDSSTRWTRLGAIASMSLVIGGGQKQMILGGEVFVDNIRVVRQEKPFWESFRFMAEQVVWDDEIKDYKRIGFSGNRYCYSPLHPDYKQWVAAAPYRAAADY